MDKLKHYEQLQNFKEFGEKTLPAEFEVIEYLLEEMKREFVIKYGEQFKFVSGYDADFVKVFGADKANRELVHNNCKTIRRMVLKISKML